MTPYRKIPFLTFVVSPYKKLKINLFCFIIILTSFYGIAVSYPERYLPGRIVSLAPTITEELYLLEVEDKIVGVTTYCERPIDAKKKEKIGTVMRINIEKILSLEPDLVLDLSMADHEQVEKLKNLGIRVVSFSQPKDFSGICDQFLELGRIVGKEEEAKRIIGIAREKVDSIRKSVKDLQKPKVFIQIGARPLFTVPRDSFIHDLIELAGGINIAFTTDTGLYNKEEVLKKNPDVIIIVTMGIVGEKEKASWQKYKTLNATKNKRIYIMDSYKVCSPTPISFAETLEEMVKFVNLGDET